MSNYNIYFSPTGGTKKVADALASNIFAENIEAPAESSYEDFDICHELPQTELQDLLDAQGFRCVAAVAAVAEHSLFRQFAAGRPDSDDMNDLVRFSRKIRAAMVQFTAKHYGKLRLSGSHIAYKPYSGGPFKPVGNENCTACGFCAEECPASAIDKANPKEVNSDKCISCMRCVKVCPKHARGCDAVLLKNMSEKMAPALSPRKSNFLFLPSEGDI